jgi:hypothetical protein
VHGSVHKAVVLGRADSGVRERQSSGWWVATIVARQWWQQSRRCKEREREREREREMIW